MSVTDFIILAAILWTPVLALILWDVIKEDRQDTAAKYWYADKSEYEKRQTILSIATLIFTGLAAAAAVAAAIAAFWAFKETQTQATAAVEANKINRDTLDASNRAWLGISHVEFGQGMDDEDGPTFVAHFQNVGRFPALDIKTGGGWQVLPLTKKLGPTNVYPETPGWQAIDLTIKGGCLANSPMWGANVQFPSSTHEGNIVIPFSPSSPGARPDLASVRNETAIILITGCLTYFTLGKPHHTGFCQYIRRGIAAGTWETRNCPAGNFAE